MEQKLEYTKRIEASECTVKQKWECKMEQTWNTHLIHNGTEIDYTMEQTWKTKLNRNDFDTKS